MCVVLYRVSLYETTGLSKRSKDKLDMACQLDLDMACQLDHTALDNLGKKLHVVRFYLSVVVLLRISFMQYGIKLPMVSVVNT